MICHFLWLIVTQLDIKVNWIEGLHAVVVCGYLSGTCGVINTRSHNNFISFFSRHWPWAEMFTPVVQSDGIPTWTSRFSSQIYQDWNRNKSFRIKCKYKFYLVLKVLFITIFHWIWVFMLEGDISFVYVKLLETFMP